MDTNEGGGQGDRQQQQQQKKKQRRQSWDKMFVRVAHHRRPHLGGDTFKFRYVVRSSYSGDNMVISRHPFRIAAAAGEWNQVHTLLKAALSPCVISKTT